MLATSALASALNSSSQALYFGIKHNLEFPRHTNPSTRTSFSGCIIIQRNRAAAAILASIDTLASSRRRSESPALRSDAIACCRRASLSGSKSEYLSGYFSKNSCCKLSWSCCICSTSRVGCRVSWRPAKIRSRTHCASVSRNFIFNGDAMNAARCCARISGLLLIDRAYRNMDVTAIQSTVTETINCLGTLIIILSAYKNGVRGQCLAHVSRK